ncbi:ABC transporter permease [Haloglycomyces albus]|uniref:ABC transporter permease n=1 Tax=Haloglycomyces albus TaxID=526067 RepID=UPI00046CCADE|nr:ABC transporter permease [Haloglycomyces albus]
MTQLAQPTPTDKATLSYPAGAWRASYLHFVNYRRSWTGSIFSALVMPILYMIGIGLGVGQYVDSSSLGGMEYAEFIAPGIVGMVAVTLASSDFIYPVYGGYRDWGSQYLSQRVSPLRPVDILNGHLLYGILFRATVSCTFVFLVLTLFGVFTSYGAVLLVPIAMIVSFACAPWIFTWCSAIDNETMLNVVFRFAVMPITLFSGVFFPISQMPLFLQPLGWASPLWHGVELGRTTAHTGIESTLHPALHVLYLLALGTAGWFAARRIVTKRLNF